MEWFGLFAGLIRITLMQCVRLFNTDLKEKVIFAYHSIVYNFCVKR